MSHTLKVEYNENTDEYYIILPEKLLKQLNWIPGDKLDIKIKKDNTISLTKVK